MSQMGSAEGIEIFAISSFIVDVDDYPVFTRPVRWIGVADQQTRLVGKSICSKDASLTHQIKAFFITQIGREIERVQRKPI